MTQHQHATAASPSSSGREPDNITENPEKKEGRTNIHALEFRKEPLNKPKPVLLTEKIQQHPWFKLARKHLLQRQAGRWFALMVLMPWLACAVYFVGFASDRFVSEASFMVEKNDGGQSAAGFSLLGITPQTGNDQRILETFIQSPDMLNYLEQQLNLRQHYIEQPDWLSSLGPEASYEDFLAYYREHLMVQFNSENGMLNLEVQGFTPDYTQQLAQQILGRSEAFVNEISHALANEQQAFVQKEVVLAEQRLKAITAELLAFQSANGLLSATDQGAALSGILNELQGELVRSQTELQTLSSYLNGNSSKIVTLKQRINALETQLTKEKLRLASSDGNGLSDLVAKQAELQLDINLATQAYSATLIALEKARTEASRKIKQLVVVSSPQLAEDARYPNVGYNLTNILLMLLMIFALVRMIRATVREHQD
ncbi:hypothetical protein [Endozoicomonas sp.]|uniref:hypothetical protein n=1 Tax=Endozoicomonas sp. TaxID=1892382 RepID=UPI002884A948|nr:hypothetical protein [Endozoicomonas sp.]